MLDEIVEVVLLVTEDVVVLVIEQNPHDSSHVWAREQVGQKRSLQRPGLMQDSQGPVADWHHASGSSFTLWQDNKREVVVVSVTVTNWVVVVGEQKLHVVSQ